MNPYGAFQHHLAKQITIRGAPQVPDMNQPRDGGGGRQKDIVRSEKGKLSLNLFYRSPFAFSSHGTTADKDLRA